MNRINVNMYVAKAKEFAIRHRHVISGLLIVGLLLLGVNVWLSYETDRAREMVSTYGKPQDWESAIEMAQLPARLGYGPAEGLLCWSYYRAQQYSKAVPWCEESFRSIGGNKNPIYLAEMYLSGGEGLPHDYQKAREYFEISADLGVISATEGLAEMYRRGLGVQRDLETVVMWLEITLMLYSKHPIESEIHRVRLELADLRNQMSLDDYALGQYRAAQWMAEYEKGRGR